MMMMMGDVDYFSYRLCAESKPVISGKMLIWVSRSAGCGRASTSDHGVITSPNYPDPYPHDSYCIYTISVPADEVITFNITNIDIESHANCAWDYLEVSEMDAEAGRSSGWWCLSQLSLCAVEMSAQVNFTRSSPQWWSGRSTTAHDVLNLWSLICGPSAWGTWRLRIWWAQLVVYPLVSTSSLLIHKVYLLPFFSYLAGSKTFPPVRPPTRPIRDTMTITDLVAMASSNGKNAT